MFLSLSLSPMLATRRMLRICVFSRCPHKMHFCGGGLYLHHPSPDHHPGAILPVCVLKKEIKKEINKGGRGVNKFCLGFFAYAVETNMELVKTEIQYTIY